MASCIKARSLSLLAGSSSPAERRKKAIEWRKSQRADPELERAARTRTLDVDLDAVAAEHLDSGGALVDIRNAADLVCKLNVPRPNPC